MHVSLDPQWTNCGMCNCIDGEASIARWSIRGALEPTRFCPRRQITPHTQFFLSVFQHYQAGFLLFAGGIADQPAIYLEAMSVIASELVRNSDG